MFHISRQVDYAAQFCRDLAALQPGQVLSLKEFAESRNISFLFMQKIARQLREAGLVVSTRGANGGYELAGDATALNMKDLIVAVEGDYAIVECARKDNTCHKSGDCEMQGTFLNMQKQMEHVLENTPVITT